MGATVFVAFVKVWTIFVFTCLTHGAIHPPLIYPTVMVSRWKTFPLPLAAGWVFYTVTAGRYNLIEAVCNSNFLKPVYMSAALLQGCTRPGRQVAVAPSICGSPVCNLFHVPHFERSDAQKFEVAA
jgi:hypothetical protein